MQSFFIILGCSTRLLQKGNVQFSFLVFDCSVIGLLDLVLTAQLSIQIQTAGLRDNGHSHYHARDMHVADG